MIKKLIIILILLKSLVIAFALSIDGVSVGMDFMSLFNVRGMPQYIGPALENVVDVNTVVSPPPFGVASMTKGTGSSSSSGGSSPTTSMGGSISSDMGISQDKEPLVPIGTQNYIIFLYKHDLKMPGKSYTPNYNTYVFLDRYTGSVLQTIIWSVPGKQPMGLVPPQGVTLGSTILQLVNNLGRPEETYRIGDFLVYNYRSNGVCYSIDQTHKVVGICIGNRGLTLIPVKETTTSSTSSSTGSGGAVPAQPSSGLPPLNTSTPYSR